VDFLFPRGLCFVCSCSPSQIFMLARSSLNGYYKFISPKSYHYPPSNAKISHVIHSHQVFRVQFLSIYILNLQHAVIMLLIALIMFAVMIIFFSNGSTAPWGPRPPHYWGFTITLRHTTLGRTPLDEWPARRRDLYLTTHNTHKRQTSMPPAGFEPINPVSERPQTHALDRTATGIGDIDDLLIQNAFGLSLSD
jgi:hypothetical protein